MTQTDTDPRAILLEGRRQLAECAATIETVMRLCGMSTSRLAGIVGITRQTLQSRLAGTTRFDRPEVAAIGAALGVPEEVLLQPAPDAIRWVLDDPEKAEELLSTRAARSGWSGFVADEDESALQAA